MQCVSALHEDDLAVDDDLVRRLIETSVPQYAALDLQRLQPSGSSNALFRLGDELLVRVPRQPGGSATIAKEARWLTVVAPAMSAAVPMVVEVGGPGFGYPEKWSVTTWLEGRVPTVPWDVAASGSSQRVALDLARFVIELRGLEVPLTATEDPALSSYRGGRLADLDDDFRQWVRECRAIRGLHLDLNRVLHVWNQVVAAEPTTALRPTWYHGDLLAENLLLSDGRLAAVLDFGGLAVGDPSVDLVVAWEVLDPAGRQAFRRMTAVCDAEWTRGMGWALYIAMSTFPYYWHTMPARCAARRSMACAVLAEA